MGRFDTRSICAIVGGTLISAFLIFKFEWHFITHGLEWSSILLWISYQIVELLVSTVAFILLSVAAWRWLIGPIIRFLEK